MTMMLLAQAVKYILGCSITCATQVRMNVHGTFHQIPGSVLVASALLGLTWAIVAYARSVGRRRPG
jgi:hypothetical protein